MGSLPWGSPKIGFVSRSEWPLLLTALTQPKSARCTGTIDVTPKRPRDPNQLAKAIIDIATGQAGEHDPDAGKDPAAVALGRKGGLKGGAARSASMTPEQRTQAAKKAADARWKKP
jgi:hypothetical protein